MFHAIVVNRTLFGSIGFSIPYEFTMGDYDAGLQELKMITSRESHDNMFKVLQFLIGEIHYGGHVTDGNDMLILKTLTEGYFNSKAV